MIYVDFDQQVNIEALKEVLKYKPFLLDLQTKLQTEWELSIIEQEKLSQLIELMYEAELVYSFDYTEWVKEGGYIYFDDPTKVHDIDFETVRKLITSIILRNHFFEGFILSNIANGMMVRLFERLNDFIKEEEVEREK
ncbi:DUF6508 domain-containing protein [Peribacillus tepidiphilus]|uniref:DUF6508 domain-containing protein n=1 Tax=Peribacillus tepidiphilus TaxID=2652445 RepID=UPI0035B51E0C